MFSPSKARCRGPRIAIAQVNGRHRIPVIFRLAAWAGTMSGLVDAELPASGNGAAEPGRSCIRSGYCAPPRRRPARDARVRVS
jgi:hypothetical protein